MAYLIRPLPFLLFMGCTLAVGLLNPSTDSALARCENRGGSVAECRLIVLGWRLIRLARTLGERD
jgi:hypothetical protein